MLFSSCTLSIPLAPAPEINTLDATDILSPIVRSSTAQMPSAPMTAIRSRITVQARPANLHSAPPAPPRADSAFRTASPAPDWHRGERDNQRARRANSRCHWTRDGGNSKGRCDGIRFGRPITEAAQRVSGVCACGLWREGGYPTACTGKRRRAWAEAVSCGQT